MPTPRCSATNQLRNLKKAVCAAKQSDAALISFNFISKHVVVHVVVNSFKCKLVAFLVHRAQVSFELLRSWL